MTRLCREKVDGTYCQEAFFGENGQPIKALRHVNPDGSIGGLYPEGTMMPENLYLHYTAVVMPGVTLESGQVVGSGKIIMPRRG